MARSYRSPSREAGAAITRARIVQAADELFVRDGYAATSIKAIAAAAETSVPTVHANGPKHALLIAAFEVALAGDEGRHPLAERPDLVAIMAEPDDTVAIDRYVDFLVSANHRSAAILSAMVAAADADVQVRAAYEDLEQRRHGDMEIAAAWFVQRGRIRPDQAAVAADLLGLVTGPEPWMHLVHHRGWSTRAYKAWVVGELGRLQESLGG